MLSAAGWLRGLLHAFVKFAEGDERKEKRFAGNRKHENIDPSAQMGDDSAGVEQDAAGAISHALRLGARLAWPARMLRLPRRRVHRESAREWQPARFASEC